MEEVANRQTTTVLRRITGQVREYAWGSREAIHRFLGTEPTGRPLAEIWFGAHPSAPACFEEGPYSDLAALIAAEPEATLGADVVSRFGPELPYLLKIIAPAAPLSLQAHPTLERARQGFAREEAAGIPRDHPERGYRDPNHKPELFYALEHSELLVGFRYLSESLELLDEIPAPLAADLARRIRGEGLRATMHWLLGGSVDREQVGQFINACRRANLSTGDLDEPLMGEPVARAAAVVANLAHHYPGDPATVASVLLNPVVLEPGDAIFVPAGTLHAHIRGIGVEVMASSDNVLRAGLTPKHVDVQETLACLDVRQGPPHLVVPRHTGTATIFRVPVADFELSLATISGDQPTSLPGAGPRVVLCLTGEVGVEPNGRAAETLRLRRGEAAFIPAVTTHLSATGNGQIVQADVPAGAAAAPRFRSTLARPT